MDSGMIVGGPAKLRLEPTKLFYGATVRCGDGVAICGGVGGRRMGTGTGDMLDMLNTYVGDKSRVAVVYRKRSRRVTLSSVIRLIGSKLKRWIIFVG